MNVPPLRCKNTPSQPDWSDAKNFSMLANQLEPGVDDDQIYLKHYFRTNDKLNQSHYGMFNHMMLMVYSWT